MMNIQDKAWEILLPHFPDLSPLQKTQLSALGACYREWNALINVISRKDIDNIYVHHVLHSLAIAKFFSFPAGARILDLGTGGGFPGIPLAILFPQADFLLCDAIGKKVIVAKEVTKAIGLRNVCAQQSRAENLLQRFDFVVSRAVTHLEAFVPWVWGKIDQILPESGILYLKGGDLESELDACRQLKDISFAQIQEIPVSQWFPQEFFAEKKIVYLKK